MNEVDRRIQLRMENRPERNHSGFLGDISGRTTVAIRGV